MWTGYSPDCRCPQWYRLPKGLKNAFHTITNWPMVIHPPIALHNGYSFGNRGRVAAIANPLPSFHIRRRTEHKNSKALSVQKKKSVNLINIKRVKPMSHSVKIYDTCIGCTQCVRACPTDVLEMVPWSGCKAGQIASSPRTEDCVGCKRCETACPTDFLSVRVYLGTETTRSMGLAY